MQNRNLTDVFLKEFDKYWNETLATIQCQQIQLIQGNRLRPQICLWGYLSAFSSIEESAQSLSTIASVSVSIELIHKASIMLDDWIDDDQERHGVPTFHMEHSPQDTVITSLAIIGLALKRLKGMIPDLTQKLPHYYFMCIGTLIDTIYAMAQGALKELRLNSDTMYNVENVKDVMQLETAQIIGDSMLVGYYVGIAKNNPDPLVIDSFKKIGDICGYIFQTMNDLEVFSNPQKLYAHKGNLNSDIIKSRKNIAIAMLYDVSSSSDKSLLRQNPQRNLPNLMEKYHITDSISFQLNDLFTQTTHIVYDMKKYNISNEWIEGFTSFLNYIKEFGEERLKL